MLLPILTWRGELATVYSIPPHGEKQVHPRLPSYPLMLIRYAVAHLDFAGRTGDCLLGPTHLYPYQRSQS